MRKRRGLVGLALATAATIGLAAWDHRPTAGVPREAPTSAVYPPEHLPGTILVDLVDDATPAQIAELGQRYGLELQPNSVHSVAARLNRAVTDDERVPGLLERLARDPLVEVAERDGLYRTQGWRDFRPNDPSYRYQWHMDQIRMPAAWPLSRGRGVVVAVIDTGVAYRDDGEAFRQVPDLAGTAFVPGYDFVDDNDVPLDENGHGTHVAGTIAQTTNNGVGVTGVAFEARIMPIRVLDRRGFGSYGDIADGIRFAADHGADVINMSLGGPVPSLAIWQAVRYAHRRGVVIVAAAGNTGRGRVGYPAAARHVMAVSATVYDEGLAWYSSWGPAVDIAAPGGDTREDRNGDGLVDGVVQNTILPGSPSENDYIPLNGTSMASPHVAGAAALLVAQGITNPVAVERILERTARSEGRDPQRFGGGILDAAAALHHAQLRFGTIRLVLAFLLAGLVLLGLRRSGRLETPSIPGLVAGLVAGASGLFFLPALAGTLVPEPLMTLLSRPVMAWDLAILGPGGHANPLFHSALLPVALTLGLLGFRRARGPVAGLALGGAAYLLFCSLWATVDVTWIPLRLLDHLWLLGNAGVSALMGHLVLRKAR